MSTRHVLAVVTLLVPGTALAQPTLDALWPNDNGLRWEYELVVTSTVDAGLTGPAALWLDGTVQTAGGTAQVLYGEHVQPSKAGTGAAVDPLLVAVWRARPDLRAAIAARTGVSLEGGPTWWPLLLHDGYFMKNPTDIQMWQASWDHPTWTYLTDNLAVGASFMQQLIPELASDVFLHGTVESVEATVSTGAGTYEHAVRMHYVIDYGWTEEFDGNQQLIGRTRTETRGHVHFVPGVGPVEVLEDFVPYAEVDCAPAACPQEWTDQIGVSVETKTLSLAHEFVAVEPSTWGMVKSLYRQ